MKKTGHTHLQIAFVLTLVIFFLAGCAARHHKPLQVLKGSSVQERTESGSSDTGSKRPPRIAWVQQPEKAVVAAAGEGRKSADFAMNFDMVAVPDFIEALMTGIFKGNYYMAPAVRNLKTRFTVKMSTDVGRDALFSLFTRILALHNVAVDIKQNTCFFSVGRGAAVTVHGPILYGRKIPADFPARKGEEITLFVPFFNINPSALKGVLSSRMPALFLSVPVKDSNLLLMNGRFEDIAYGLELIRLLDRAQFKDKSILMINPVYWEIPEFSEKLKELLTAEGIDIEKANKARSLVFIPLEKMNAMMVITAVSEWAQRIVYWLNRLDVPEAAGEAQNVYAYKLKNVDVDSVTGILESYGKISPGGIQQPEKSGSGQSVQQALSSEHSREARIIAVKETNTLIIVAAPVIFRKYRDILKKIDVPRNQVFVEVIIGEVSLKGTNQLGLEFWMDKVFDGRGAFGTRDGFGLSADGIRGNFTGSISSSQFEILMNALVTSQEIEIISTPKLTVAENAQAEISVGASVPVISSESGITGSYNENQSGGFYPYRSIQYVETGIILKVKAAILTENKIALEITQEISEAAENRLTDIASPEILKRTVKTTLIVEEGEIAFIGGLIQKKKTRSSTGVPLLAKIPLLGNLFKKSARESLKSELVLFINAKTLRKRNDMDEIVAGVKKMVDRDIVWEKK